MVGVWVVDTAQPSRTSVFKDAKIRLLICNPWAPFTFFLGWGPSRFKTQRSDPCRRKQTPASPALLGPRTAEGSVPQADPPSLHLPPFLMAHEIEVARGLGLPGKEHADVKDPRTWSVKGMSSDNCIYDTKKEGSHIRRTQWINVGDWGYSNINTSFQIVGSQWGPMGKNQFLGEGRGGKKNLRYHSDVWPSKMQPCPTKSYFLVFNFSC